MTIFKSVNTPELKLEADDVWPCDECDGRDVECPECKGHGYIHGHKGNGESYVAQPARAVPGSTESRRFVLRGIDFREVASVEGRRGTSPTVTFRDGREPQKLKAYPGDDLYGRCVSWLAYANREGA